MELIKTKEHAADFLNTITYEFTLMNWLKGEKIFIRFYNNEYILEDSEKCNVKATKENAIDFIYKHRKVINDKDIEKVYWDGIK